nr:hypothetical protein [uncultured Draconibacterium sp.]
MAKYEEVERIKQVENGEQQVTAILDLYEAELNETTDRNFPIKDLGNFDLGDYL